MEGLISDMRSGPSLWTYLVLFDTVWHPAFITKLSAEGIQGHLQTWFTAFHSSHSPHVSFNGIHSSPLPVKVGVPQGSVLGTLLCGIIARTHGLAAILD